jgi:hypothetical protein
METNTEKQSAYIEINSLIKETVQNSGPKIKETYVNAQVEKEITKRVDLLGKLIELLSSLRKNLNKVKPDVFTYNEIGEVVSSSYSKNVVESRKKLVEGVQKAEKTLDLALNNNDYNNVDQVLNQLGSLTKNESKPENKDKVENAP